MPMTPNSAGANSTGANSTLLADHADAATAAVPIVGGGEILSMGLSMLVVVVAILLLGWLYSRSKFVSGGASNLINVVASRALGPKERLLVVEVADQQLLVGMTSTAVQTLHVFDKPVCIAEAATDPAGFKDRLRTVLREMGK